MWAAVFATAKATVTLECGSSSSTFTVTPGVNTLKIPLAAGKMTVKMVRNGQTIINETPEDFTYSLNPELCTFFFFSFFKLLSRFLFNTNFFYGALDNFNAWVGSATTTSRFLLNNVGFMMPNSLYRSITSSAKTSTHLQWTSSSSCSPYSFIHGNFTNFDLFDKTILF